MSDRQELIDWLRHWKHEVPTTREREEMIEAMRDAATALEEAQGVPQLRAITEQSCGECDYDEAEGGLMNHCNKCCRKITTEAYALAHAAPAAPTRDEQDARRFYALAKLVSSDEWERISGHWPTGDELDAYRCLIDAALAEPKR